MAKEPSFGKQCKDNSSCGSMSSGSTMGEPSKRMSDKSDQSRNEGFKKSEMPPGYPAKGGSDKDMSGC